MFFGFDFSVRVQELAAQARKSGRYAHVRLLDGDAADPGPVTRSEK